MRNWRDTRHIGEAASRGYGFVGLEAVMEMHVIAQTVLPGELVFDIGANLGDKAAWFADRGARVVAVEPQPKMADFLRQRFANNALVTVVAKGVADKVGTLEMSISDNHVLSTFSDEWKTGRFKDNQWNQVLPIEVTTLDQLIGEYGVPRYAKIDVEGYEQFVMKGLSKKIPVLSFEYSAELLDRAESICRRLKEIGYAYFNVGFGELPDFVYPNHWESDANLIAALRNHAKEDPMNWGDIYAA